MLSLEKQAQQQTNSKLFNYDNAFCRNLGWVTKNEQNVLKNSKIAIAGLGGVGGRHLLALVRLGISNFNIADFDCFEIENFNRQEGAGLNSIGKSKVSIMEQQALNINPKLKINSFKEGLKTSNIEAFLDGIDLYIDGLDFFEINMRIAIFQRCQEIGIPAITVAPIGMGASTLCFHPKHMSFNQYFCFVSGDDENNYLKFTIGLNPWAIHRKSLVNKKYFDLKNHRAPSLAAGTQQASAFVSALTIKILLRRGKVYWAPKSIQLDNYSLKYRKSWLPFGAKNPFFKLKLFLLKKWLSR